MKNKTDAEQRKQAFACELIIIQEAICRCTYKIKKLEVNGSAQQFLQEQENLHYLEDRMRQVLKSYDSCTEES